MQLTRYLYLLLFITLSVRHVLGIPTARTALRPATRTSATRTLQTNRANTQLRLTTNTMQPMTWGTYLRGSYGYIVDRLTTWGHALKKNMRFTPPSKEERVKDMFEQTIAFIENVRNYKHISTDAFTILFDRKMRTWKDIINEKIDGNTILDLMMRHKDLEPNLFSTIYTLKKLGAKTSDHENMIDTQFSTANE